MYVLKQILFSFMLEGKMVARSFYFLIILLLLATLKFKSQYFTLSQLK